MSRPDDFISKESRFSKILGIATRVLLSLMVLSLLITSAALATTIPITATGAGLTVAGTPDPNWLIENDTAYPGLNGQPAQLLAPGCNNWYTGWLANGPDSNWIGITANKTNNGPAPYSFQYTFNLSSFVLSTVSLSGSWTIDDEGTLSVNDHVISTLGNGNWVSLDNFSLAAGSGLLNQGLNTLDINMTSDDQYLEGGRLEGSITGTQVPEPCTMLLLGSGLAGLAGFRSRFKRS